MRLENVNVFAVSLQMGKRLECEGKKMENCLHSSLTSNFSVNFRADGLSIVLRTLYINSS